MIFFIFKKIPIIIFLILPVLLSVAFFTLLERKVIATIQNRTGPSILGTTFG
jgi:NADH:ubiquinone oxidoreductase subunit H